jgi:hypothetical protein
MIVEEKKIIALLGEKGPLTGSEIWDVTGGDPLGLWQACMLSRDLSILRIGTRYLRLDRRVEGYARLSPSILREFLTYSVIGLAKDQSAIAERARKISLHIEAVSRAKSQLAFSTVAALTNQFETERPIKEDACFILAGDIVYNMAHDVPRPERSTGKLVQGSDMDLVVVVDDHFPESFTRRLDEAIYGEKYRLLIAPHLREEIDYIVKDMNRVRTQLAFDTYRHMVACKIMQEGTLLYGSERIFTTIKSMLKDYGVTDNLRALEQQAEQFREETEKYLLEGKGAPDEDQSHLFYPAEESEEFE